MAIDSLVKLGTVLHNGAPYKEVLGDVKYDVLTPHILINQIYGGKKKESYASHSFIELYNPTDEDVDLSGWSLQYRSSINGGDDSVWSKLDLMGMIYAHSSFLVRCKKINDPILGSLDIVDYDQEWNQVINNKGCSIVLVANNRIIESDSVFFDNNTGKPVISDYVDMIGVSGNDTENETQIADEAALFYEKEASRVQSKKIGIRRKRIEDTDDNSVEGDFEEVDYSFDNAEYRNYIKPKCSLDGVWIFNESEIPHYTVSFVKFAGGGYNSKRVCIYF